MIDLHGVISIPFLKKSRFTGSYMGMRYQLEKQEEAILATIWPEPFNFEKTPEEKKHTKEFPFTTDGIWEAVDWLNQEHAAGHF